MLVRHPSGRAPLKAYFTIETPKNPLHFRRKHFQRFSGPVPTDNAYFHRLCKQSTATAALDQHQAVPLILKNKFMSYMKIVTACADLSFGQVARNTCEGDLKITDEIKARRQVAAVSTCSRIEHEQVA